MDLKRGAHDLLVYRCEGSARYGRVFQSRRNVERQQLQLVDSSKEFAGARADADHESGLHFV